MIGDSTKEITLYTIEYPDGSIDYVAHDNRHPGIEGIGDTLELALGSCLIARQKIQKGGIKS